MNAIRILYCALIIYNFSFCYSDSKVDSTKILSNVLDLEFTFGKDNLKDEYLLVRPRFDLAVNDAGDIFIADENRVKVYYNNGKERALIGRGGPGPGEFQSIGIPTIGPTGILTVGDRGRGFNVWNSDYKFMTSVNIRNNPLYATFIQGSYSGGFNVSSPIVISLNETERLGYYVTSEIESNFQLQCEILSYEKEGKIIELVTYKPRVSLHSVSAVGAALPFTAHLEWDLINDNKVIFTHPQFDYHTEKDSSWYTLHIVSLSNFDKTYIERYYSMIEIPDSIKNSLKPYSRRTELDAKNSVVPPFLRDELNDRKQKARELIWDYSKNITHHLPIQQILVDGSTVFVFTYQQNKSMEYLVDIFDGNSEQYIKSVFFSVIPGEIKNGYAYKINYDEEGFFFLEKYKIDPSVYEK